MNKLEEAQEKRLYVLQVADHEKNHSGPLEPW